MKQSTPRRRPQLTYYRSAAKNSDDSPFTATDRRPSRFKHFINRTISLLVVFLILIGFVFSLIVKPSARVITNDLSYHPTSAYASFINQQLEGLKNRNKLTINETKIISQAQKRFPEINNASLELPIFGQSPVVHLNIAQPSFRLQQSKNSYVVDTAGVAVASASDLKSLKNLVSVNDESNFAIAPGEQVISSSAVSFISALIEQCREDSIAISSLVLPNAAQQLNLRTSDRPYLIKFYLGGDPSQQIGQFLAARHNFDSKNQQPSEYLDVRVNGKVFYK